MITKEYAKQLSQKLKEPAEMLQERLDTIGELEGMPLPKLKEGLSTTLDHRKMPTSINNQDYHRTTTHIIKHGDKKITAKLFSEANDYEKELIEKYQHSLVSPEKDRLTALHKAAMDEGIFIVIPPHHKVEEQITLISEYDTNGFTHILVVAHAGSEASITRHVNEQKRAEGKGLVCDVVEIKGEEGSKISYNEHQSLSKETSWYTQKKAIAKPKANVQWYSHIIGADLSLQTTTTALNGHDATSTILGTTSLEGNQHNDNHAIIQHVAANTRSGMYTKAVLGGEARTIHKGFVEIGDEARESEGYQQEDILLTSGSSEADAIPELDIRNEQVICSHGATIGNIPDNQMYYLRSRGMDEEGARRLIMEGFLKSITSHTEDREWQRIIIDIINGKEEKEA